METKEGQTTSCNTNGKGYELSVLSVTCSQNHVMSVGMDNRLCLFKRRRGSLIGSIWYV